MALAFLPLEGGSWDLVLSPGAATKQAAAPTMLPEAEQPVYEARDQLPKNGATVWVGVPIPHMAGKYAAVVARATARIALQPIASGSGAGPLGMAAPKKKAIPK